jgi:hypothetical protein
VLACGFHVSRAVVLVTSLTVGRPGGFGNADGCGDRWKTTAFVDGESTVRKATSDDVVPVSLDAWQMYIPESVRRRSDMSRVPVSMIVNLGSRPIDVSTRPLRNQ